jgi:hypothetical protein
MKTLLTIFTLVFAVMFSSTSFAGWTKAGENMSRDTFYVDFERIRKHGGYVYYWMLVDKLKPTETGTLSYKTYFQGDCKQFRVKRVTASYHTQPMGEGTPNVSGATKNQQWIYPPPNSTIEEVLKSVCSR